MKNLYQLLGLTKNEQKVVETVAHEEKIVATIAREAKLPRTTVDDIAERLALRGLLQKTKKSKRFYYKKASATSLIQTLFPQNLPQGIHALPLLEGAGIILHSGTNELMQVYENLFTNSSTNRIYGIQPTASALAILEKIPHSKINYLNSLISKNKLVMESVLEADYFEKIKGVYEKKFAHWQKIFINRASITHIIEEKTISFQSELVLHGKVALLVDWQNSIAIEIFHPEITKTLLDLFHSFQKLGRRIELRTFSKSSKKRFQK